jgi:CheY-like chemotaxis protein
MKNEPKVEPATPALAAKDTFRILIMDTPEHVEQLKAACKNAGHSVISANRITEAFRFLDGTNHADVIVCAAHLEDESVFEFLQKLRNNDTHKNSMFMILSLAAGPVGVQLNSSTQKAAQLLGADAYVSMPKFDAGILIAEIKKLLPQIPWLERNRREDEEKQRAQSEVQHES